MTKDEIFLHIEAASRRLNNRCKGFLETVRDLEIYQSYGLHPSQLTVQYLHRTVKDFIKTPKARSFLQSSVNPGLDPSIQLCVACLMEMKALHGLRFGVNREDNLSSLHLLDLSSKVVHCFRQAAGVAKASESAIIELLDELKAVFEHSLYLHDLFIDFMGRELLNDRDVL